MSEHLRYQPELGKLGEIWRLPSTGPFTALVDGFYVDDVYPLVAFYRERTRMTIGYGVTIPSFNAVKRDHGRVDGVNLLLPLIYPHVISVQGEISTEIIRDTVEGISYHLRHDVPPRENVSSELLRAYSRSGDVLDRLDPRLTDSTAIFAATYNLPVDWKSLADDVKQLELSPTPFIHSVSVS